MRNKDSNMLWFLVGQSSPETADLMGFSSTLWFFEHDDCFTDLLWLLEVGERDVHIMDVHPMSSLSCQ